MLSHRVGNGEHTFLWYDKWHPFGPLVEKFGTRVIYDSALPRNSRVSTVILNNSWAWPVRPSRIANSGALMAIRDGLTQIPIHGSSQDRVIWDPSPNGIFSTAATWKSLYDDPNTVHWYKLVWFQGATPRHSIFFFFEKWLVKKKEDCTDVQGAYPRIYNEAQILTQLPR